MHNGTDFLWTESTDTMRFPQAPLRKNVARKCGVCVWKFTGPWELVA